MWPSTEPQEHGLRPHQGQATGTLGSDQGDAWVTEDSPERGFNLRGGDSPGWVLVRPVTPAVCLWKDLHILKRLSVKC